jgi:hypothetical protein
MRVFISWSGVTSQRIAEAFYEWLPSSLQFVQPYFSPVDIDKGTKWFTEIFQELSQSTAGLIILTRESLTSSWIMFEAGAIATKIEKARVCPLIFGLEKTDLQGPLAQFQATNFNRDDIRQLFLTINAAAGSSRLSEGIAENVFEKWWPDLEKAVGAAIDLGSKDQPNEVRREVRDLAEETLLLVRNIDINTRPRPALDVPPVPYENTLYPPIFGLAEYLYDRGAYEDPALKEILDYLADLREKMAARRMVSPVRDGLLASLEKLEARVKSDYIPF